MNSGRSMSVARHLSSVGWGTLRLEQRIVISKKLTSMLTEQVGYEFGASQFYLAGAAYFGRMGLDKWKQIFSEQSDEERMHARKIVDFLVDVGVEFDLPSVPPAKTKFKSPLDAVKAALANEQKVTKQFNDMAAAAISEKDFTSFQFLQWFIQEQVEEEAKMGKLVQVVGSGTDLYQQEDVGEEECEG